jgi:hypothetical protein
MTLTKRVLSAAGVIVLSAGTAWAGGGQPHSGSAPSASGQLEQLSFEQLDVNQDGKLSAAEYNAGIISQGSAGTQSPQASSGGMSVDSSSGAPVLKSEPSPMASDFEHADQDRDGQLSRSEFDTLASSGASSEPLKRESSLGS